MIQKVRGQRNSHMEGLSHYKLHIWGLYPGTAYADFQRNKCYVKAEQITCMTSGADASVLHHQI